MTFPGVKALDNVDFTLRKGRSTPSWGKNGAGKSTLIKCLTGINDFEAGEIRVDGIEGPVKNHSTLDAQKVGISTVYQEVNLCPNLSVAENLYIGREPMTPFHTIDRRTMNKKADELVKRLDIKVDVTQNLENYSLAIQQMIAIARAVDMDCKVLILDEPTSSLDDSEVEKLFKMMLQLKEHGGGHRVRHPLPGAGVRRVRPDHRAAQRHPGGRVSVAELPRVKLVAAMMGKDFDDLASIKPEGFPMTKEAPWRSTPGAEPQGHHQALRPGHPQGRGHRPHRPAGLRPQRAGPGHLRRGQGPDRHPEGGGQGGQDQPAHRRHEPGHGPAARRPEGGGHHRRPVGAGKHHPGPPGQAGHVQPAVPGQAGGDRRPVHRPAQIKTASRETPIKQLSGGNQQKAILARWLATDPDFLILDEPTRGIDIGTKTEIQKLIIQLAQRGQKRHVHLLRD